MMARNDDRNADREAKPEQEIIAFCSRRDRNDVVETHHDIGDDDYADRAPQVLNRFGRIFRIVRLRRHELDGHPEKHKPAGELEVG